MKINYKTKPLLKIGDKVRIKKDCEWNWEEDFKNRIYTVERISIPIQWNGSKIKAKRPGLFFKGTKDSCWDSFGFEHI